MHIRLRAVDFKLHLAILLTPSLTSGSLLRAPSLTHSFSFPSLAGLCFCRRPCQCGTHPSLFHRNSWEGKAFRCVVSAPSTLLYNAYLVHSSFPLLLSYSVPKRSRILSRSQRESVVVSEQEVQVRLTTLLPFQSLHPAACKYRPAYFGDRSPNLALCFTC